MTSPRAELPPDRPAGLAGVPGGAGTLTIDDHLEPRIRLPADALRCVLVCIEIVLLIGLALLARATVSGVEANVVGASQLAESKLLSSLERVIRDLAQIALLILPLALAARMLVRGQPRRLAEAIGAAAVAAVVVYGVNLLLQQSFAGRVHNALTLSAARAQHVAVLDAKLAALVAYITVIGLVRPPAVADRVLGGAGVLPGRPAWPTAPARCCRCC